MASRRVEIAHVPAVAMHTSALAIYFYFLFTSLSSCAVTNKRAERNSTRVHRACVVYIIFCTRYTRSTLDRSPYVYRHTH